MIEFPKPPGPTAPPPAVYCPTCGRTVKAEPGAKAPRHNNLDTGQVCRPVGMIATTDPDPDTRSVGHPSPPDTPTGGEKDPHGGGTSTGRGRPAAKRARGKSKAKKPASPAAPPDDVKSDDEVAADAVRRAARSYPATVKAEAIARMGTHGIAATHDMMDIPKSTLSSWARDANIDTGAVARRQTEAASIALRARVAQAKLSTVAMLEQHLADYGEFLRRVGEVNVDAVQAIIEAGPDAIERKIGLAGPYVVVTDTTAAAAADLAMALAGLPLSIRDAEGIVTRAVHDLQLLKGEATERGEVVIEFSGMPRPRPAEVEVVRVEANPPTL